MTTCRGCPNIVHFFYIFIGPSCRHIKKGTDQTLLKKLPGNPDWTSCQDCKPEENEENKENVSSTEPQDTEEETETAPIWMCLKCGHRVSLFNPFIIQIVTAYEVTFCQMTSCIFSTRAVDDSLRTSMPSNITRLLDRIHIVW